MYYQKLIFGFLLNTLTMAAAHAQPAYDQIRLGNPTYNGSGCPIGSASAQLSPDAQSLSILFSGFQAQAGGSSGNSIDRKACNLAIPVTVPQGYSVSVFKIDYRGYYNIPDSASATFDVEYFFAGTQGPSYHKSIVGKRDGNFTFNNQLMAESVIWSPCGEDVNLRTSTSVAVQSNNYNEQTLMALDSADITSGVVYQLKWRSCNGNDQHQWPGNPGGGNAPAPTPYPTPYATPYPTPYATPYPTYPTPVPAPNPYPYPPQPAPSVGACVISSAVDYRGIMNYIATDGYGRVLVSSPQYASARNSAERAYQQGLCQGIVNRVQANPAPYPAPRPVSSCRVLPGGNAYGQRFFRVLDRSGRIINNSSTQGEAQRIAQSDARCFQ